MTVVIQTFPGPHLAYASLMSVLGLRKSVEFGNLFY